MSRQTWLKGTQSVCVDSLLLPGVIAELCKPTGPRQTNDILFKVCRCIVTIEETQRALTKSEKIKIFNEWFDCAKATGFLRWRRERYTKEFFNRLKYTKSGIHETSIHEAWTQANQSAPPDDALMYFPDDDQRHIRLVVCLCRELQRAAGDPNKGNEFFLSVRSVSELLGFNKDTNAMKGQRILETIQECEFIRKTKPGKRPLATQWVYLKEL